MSTNAPGAQGLKRTDIQEHDLSVPGRVVIPNRVDVSPDAPIFRHKDPGEEVIYVWKDRWSTTSTASRRQGSARATA